MSDAATHFTADALSEPAGPGRYVHIDSITPAEFVPGLGFRPVLGQRAMANFVNFAPGVEAPRHVHSEEQIVVVLDGEFTFDLDGDVRVMRRGDVAVIPAWLPHGAWTTDSHCLELDIFCPPRKSLLGLAGAQDPGESGAAPAARETGESGPAPAERESGESGSAPAARD